MSKCKESFDIITHAENEYFNIKYCQVLFDISKNNLILWAILEFREKNLEGMRFISTPLNVV